MSDNFLAIMLIACGIGTIAGLSLAVIVHRRKQTVWAFTCSQTNPCKKCAKKGDRARW